MSALRHPRLAFAGVVAAFFAVAVPLAGLGRREAPVETRPPPLLDALDGAIVLVDTSASRASEPERGVEAAIAVARAVAEYGGPAAPLVVAAFDQGVAAIHDGTAGGFEGEASARLAARPLLGGSAVARALGWAAVKARAGGPRRVILVSDGVATLGPSSARDLARAARALGESGVLRVDAIAVGARRDDAALGAIVRAGLARGGAVLDAGDASLGARLVGPVAAAPPPSAAAPSGEPPGASASAEPAPSAREVVDDARAAEIRRELEALDVAMVGALESDVPRPTLMPPGALGARPLRVRGLDREDVVGRAAAVNGPAGGRRASPRVGPGPIAPWTGPYADVRGLLPGSAPAAASVAWAFRKASPTSPLALLALGDALLASGDRDGATRAAGSLLDLELARPRLAAERLAALGDLEDADDAFARAIAARPGSPALLCERAFTLLRRGDHGAAMDALVAARRAAEARSLPAAVDRALREDLGLVAAAWSRAAPAEAAAIGARLEASGGLVEDAPSRRVVLTWDGDADDLDLVVREGPDRGPSQGELPTDVRGGGPETFTRRTTGARPAGPFTVSVRAVTRGPSAFVAGTVAIVDHDGRGRIDVDERPFVVEVAGATVELGPLR
jgi:hypothetical protein